MSAIARIARVMTIVAGSALLATAILVSVEVITRRLFSISFNAGSELSSYVLGIVASWGLAHTLLLRGHVRVDAAIRLFPERIRAWADLVALIGLGAVGLLILTQAWVTFAASWSMNAHSMTPLRVPLWIPQFLWVAGLAYFVFVLVWLGIRAAAALFRSDFRRSRQLIGIQGVEEEAAEALAEVRAIVQDAKAEPQS